MSEPRPVDQLPKPSTFTHTRHEARRLGVCLRCGERPNLADRLERDEYRISALCGRCYDRIMGEEEA